MGTYPEDYRRRERPGASSERQRGSARPSVSRRVVDPRSSQESYDELQRTRAHYDRERASRDPYAAPKRYGGPREVIDARGSIDSRTFNESHEISSRTNDERDRPRAAIDASMTRTRWHSRAGQGFDAVPDAGASHSLPGRLKTAGHGRGAGGVGFSGGVVSGRQDYSAGGGFLSEIPLFFKITIPLIVVLVVILVVLLLS